MVSDTSVSDTSVSDTNASWLAGAVYRAGAGRRLVPYVHAQPVDAAADDFGMLVDDRGRNEHLSVGCDTALLLYALAEPGPLPAFARDTLTVQGGRPLLALVHAGVLEVECDGRFVTGAEAVAAALGPSSTPGGCTSAGTRAAVQYGAALRLGGVTTLTERLYSFGAEPALLDDPRPVDDALVSVDRLAGLGWRAHRDDAWLWFSPCADRSLRPRWKLYASPVPEELADVLGDLAESFARGHAVQWKVARGQQVRRPDRVVAYFDTRDDLLAAAETIRGRLGGLNGSGVPFAVEIDADGLLGWGVDPATSGPRQSWRFHVAAIAARQLVVGPAGTGGDGSLAARVDAVYHAWHVAGLDVPSLTPTAAWLQEHAA